MRFTVRLPEALNEKLKKIAQLQGYSRNDVIISACWDLVRRQKPNKLDNMQEMDYEWDAKSSMRCSRSKKA